MFTDAAQSVVWQRQRRSPLLGRRAGRHRDQSTCRMLPELLPSLQGPLPLPPLPRAALRVAVRRRVTIGRVGWVARS